MVLCFRHYWMRVACYLIQSHNDTKHGELDVVSRQLGLQLSKTPWGLGGVWVSSQPSSTPSSLAPLGSTWIVASDAHFLSCFADVKTHHQTEDTNYLMTMRPQTQASWSPRTDIANPVPSPSASQRTGLITDPAHSPPTWLLKVLCQNPLGSSGFFRAWATCLLAWPCK